MVEFDMRLGTPGLHDVRGAVRAETGASALPPDLFARYERDAFWEDLTNLPKAVRVV
jgi:sulfotransferase